MREERESNSENRSTIERIVQADPRIAIGLRDLSKLRSEKTIVMALVIQLIIAGFSSIMVVGLVAVYDSGTDDTIVGITGESGDVIFDEVDQAPGVEAQEISNGDDVSMGVGEGALDAGIIATDDGDGLHLTLVVPDEELITTIVIAQLQEVTENIEHEQRQERGDQIDVNVLQYSDSHTSNPYFTFTYTVLIPLLIFLPVFISGSVIVDSITEEIERGTLLFLEASPANISGVIDGKIAAATILAPAQILLWIGLLRVNGIVIEQWLWIILYATTITIGITAMGLSISLALRNRQHSQFAYAITIVGTFSLLTLLPQSPANIVSRLSTGSASIETYVVILFTAIVSSILYIVIRKSALKGTLLSIKN